MLACPRRSDSEAQRTERQVENMARGLRWPRVLFSFHPLFFALCFPTIRTHGTGYSYVDFLICIAHRIPNNALCVFSFLFFLAGGPVVTSAGVG